MQLPQFKYHPNSYQLDIFKAEKGICSICHKERTIKYDYSFYSIDEPEYICPWCIASGEAAEKYHGSFNDYASIEGVSTHLDKASAIYLPEQFLDAVILQTPSYSSWQQERWLVHCHEPCAFIGYIGAKEMNPYFNDIKPNIEQLGYSTEEVSNNLSVNGYMVGYLFECVHCRQKRLHIGCD